MRFCSAALVILHGIEQSFLGTPLGNDCVAVPETILEISISDLKIFKESFIICSYLAHFPAQAEKKKNPSRKKFFIFLEMVLSSSNIKKFLYFLKRKLFLYFLKRKLFSYFKKWNPALFSLSSRNQKIPLENISHT